MFLFSVTETLLTTGGCGGTTCRTHRSTPGPVVGSSAEQQSWRVHFLKMYLRPPPNLAASPLVHPAHCGLSLTCGMAGAVLTMVALLSETPCGCCFSAMTVRRRTTRAECVWPRAGSLKVSVERRCVDYLEPAEKMFTLKPSKTQLEGEAQ